MTGNHYTYYDPEDLQADLPNYHFESFVTCNPGSRDIVTGMDKDGKFFHASNNEYKHLSKQNQQRFWMNNLVKRFPEYAKTIASLPSLKTLSSIEFLDNCMEMMKHRDYLFDFSKNNPFRKWRYTVNIYKQKAIETFCQRITKGVDKKKVIVGMGDWSGGNKSVIKGHSRAPVVALKRALLQHATVVRIWEYRTSIACHKCGLTCAQALLPTSPTKKQKKLLKEQQEVCASSGSSYDIQNAATRQSSKRRCGALRHHPNAHETDQGKLQDSLLFQQPV